MQEHSRPERLPETLAEAAQMLRRRAITAEFLTRACLERIAAVDRQLQACVTVLADSALEEARAADAVFDSAPRKAPLLSGIPLGIKDLIETRGIRTTAGSRVLDDYVPEQDATVVTLLRMAGAVLIAKTNTHEFAYGTFTPPTRNPWNTERVPGGSSGGSAAGLAAGEFLGALGTDTGGSIRIPAGWCGVTGLKPTYGLVSRAGIIALSDSLDHAGPIARTVEDCAILLDTLASYDLRDPGSIEAPPVSYTAALADARTPSEAVRGLRLGLPTNYFFEHCTAEVSEAVQRAASEFERLGGILEEVVMPENIPDLFQVYRTIQRPEATAYHENQGWLQTRADRYAPEVRAHLESGRQYSALDYVRAQQARQQFTRAMRAVFDHVDVLLTPTLPLPAPTVQESAAPLLVDGTPLLGNALRNTFPFDLTGQPALALPCGLSASGLPLSAQLIAAHFGEPTLLRVGHAYQRTTEWHRLQPPLAV